MEGERSGAGGKATRTLDETSARPRRRRAEPGLLAVFDAGRAIAYPLPLAGERLELGRLSIGGLREDSVASRRHLELRLEPRAWHITDLGSRNGTFVNGKRLERGQVARGRRLVLRVGHRLFVASEDLAPYRVCGVESHGAAVVGPLLGAVLERVRDAGRTGDSLLVLGESGTGKELAARAFHAAGPRAEGPFVAVNCAAIPEGVAERLLFGSTRGAFSGATDAPGYIQAAHGGTLFLDEIGELAPAVQAKLLRVVETREVLPLGAVRGQTVSTAFCFATMRPLRTLVAEQRFRADLFYRIARTTVTVPPLRDRLADIPCLVTREVAAADAELAVHWSLVEACLLAEWPGNVRELLSAVRHAAGEARRAKSAKVRAEHLPVETLDPDVQQEDSGAGWQLAGHAGEGPRRRATLNPETISEQELRAALAANGDNLTHAARALGLHRSQFYRLIERHGIRRPQRA